MYYVNFDYLNLACTNRKCTYNGINSLVYSRNVYI